MTTNQRIGSRIREVRELRGMTAQDLADDLEPYSTVHHATPDMIYRWEAGKQPIPSDSLVALMTVLQVSPYYIFNAMSPIEAEEQRVHNAIHSLPRREQNFLYHLITRWIGCIHTLLELCMLYACMPECARKLVVRYNLRIAERYRSQLDPLASTVDLEQIYAGMRRLDKGVAAEERKTRLTMPTENK